MLTPEPFVSHLSTCSAEHAPHGHVPGTSSQPMTWSVHKPPSLELRLVQQKGYTIKIPATYVALRVGAHSVHRFDTLPTPFDRSTRGRINDHNSASLALLATFRILQPLNTLRHFTVSSSSSLLQTLETPQRAFRLPRSPSCQTLF